MDAEKTLADHADTAYEAVRHINHLLIVDPVRPAPTLYPVLGSLALLGHGLHQAIGQLTAGLEASPEYYDLYEADGRHPVASIEDAARWLASAARHADNLGYALSQAQTTIAGQGWRDLDDPWADPDADEDDTDQDRADQ